MSERSYTVDPLVKEWLVADLGDAITTLQQGRAAAACEELVAIVRRLGGEPPPRPTGADD